MIPLTILTSVIRPENLPAIAASLEPGRELFDLRWWVILDTVYERYTTPDLTALPPGTVLTYCTTPTDPRTSVRTGEWVQNSVLGDFEDSAETLVWGLSDDNLAIPTFFVRLALLLEADPEIDLFVFPMRHRDGLLEASSAKMHGGSVDGGQLVYRSSLIGSLRFGPGATPDGEFAAAILAKSKNPCFLSDPVLPYNALRG